MRMKSFTLFLCVMLVAVACAGNSNKKADEQPAGDPETEQIQTNFVPVPVPKGSEGIAFKAYEQILLTKMDEYDEEEFVFNDECPDDCVLTYTSYTDDIEGYYEERTVDCLPLPDGDWLAIWTWAGAAEGEPTSYENNAYFYKDGKLEEAKGLLPVPKDITPFFKPESLEDHEDLVNTLKAAYKERPESFLVYHCGTDNQSLRIEFRPTDPYLEQYENHIWTDECWDLLKEYNDLPLYRWDGKKFVK